MSKLTFILTLFTSLSVLAVTSRDSLMDFGTWKQSQVIRAQNTYIKLKNKEVLSKRKRKQIRVPKALNSATYDLNRINQSKKKRAKKRLLLARGLRFSDYLAVYVGKYAEDSKKLNKLAKKMNTEQIVELLKNYNTTNK